MTSRIPWLRVVVEGVVIVGSILLAFGIDALWESRVEQEEEAQLLADLAEEFASNRSRLERTTDSHRLRAERLRTLIREAGPEATGLPPDSLNALAEAALINPVFGPERGVMARAQSGNGLAVVSDPDLRGNLAGFWNRFEYYLNNQAIITQRVVFSPTVIYGTGTLVWQTFPRLDSMGSTTMWSDPLMDDQVNALKYFAAAEFMSDLLARQGQTLLGDIDALLANLDEVRGR